MSSLASAFIAALIGGLVGFVLKPRLTAGSHRVGEERSHPTRSSHWVMPVMGVLSGFAWWATSLDRPLLVPVTYAASTSVMVALAFIDLAVHRLPDVIQLPAYPVLLALLALCSAATQDWSALLRAVLAGGALYAVFLFLMIVAPSGGMGFGDVKLAGLLGLLLGWQSWAHVIVGTLGTFLLGGVVAGALLASRRAGPQSEFAYGPVMMASTVATLGLLSPVTLRALI